MDVNILFTSAGRRVELLQIFRRAYEELAISGRIITVDIDPLAPALRVADKAYLVPRLHSPEYIPSLREILDRENVTAVFPLIDPDIPVMAAHRDELEATGARLAVVPPDAARTADDKWETTYFFQRLGVATPRSWLPDDVDLASMTYPVFIKPRCGSASHHTFKVETPEQLSFFCDYVSWPIIQEYLDGPEITNDVVCDLECNVLSVVSRQRIRVRDGEVVVGKTIFSPEIRDACIHIAQSLPAVGPITVQCMMNSGRPFFTEINARLGGGAPLGVAAGDDWPRRLLASLAGIDVGELGPSSYKNGVYLSRFDNSVFTPEDELPRFDDSDHYWDAIIFDLDDTLYLEHEYVMSGFRAVADWAAESLKYPTQQTFAELQRLFDAGVRGNTFDLWLEEKGLPLDQWRAAMVRAYREHKPAISLDAEVSELLERLRSHCRLGLITDGYLKVQKQKVAALELHERLDCIVYSDTWGRDAWKPSPRPFNEALAQLSANAAKTVYIGDNPAKDFRAARALGMQTIRLRRPDGLHCDLEAASDADDANMQITNLGELPATLQKMATQRVAPRAKSIRIDGPHAKRDKSSDVKTKRIYLSPPHMSPRSRQLLIEAFDSNWIAPLGPHVDLLEEEFAEKIGASQAVALSSGTAALHLALLALGVGPGDEVVTSTLTFAATANAIRYVGASPVFVDSGESTWNMDPQLLDKTLAEAARRGKMPKAVITVDLYGQCCDYGPILETCRRYGVAVIEDAAEALGATYNGRAAGNFGAVGCFSFNGNKIITASSGGMLVCREKKLADRIRHLATQARDPAVHYQHSQVGYNYRMSNLLAAVARGGLEVLDDRVDRRRANFRFYEENMDDLPGLRFMPEIAGGQSTRWLTCVTVDAQRFGATREDIRLALEAENIESRPVWKPMHMQPLYAGSQVHGGDVARRLFEQGLCLPSGSNLSESDLRRIVDVVRGVCRSNGKLRRRPQAANFVTEQ